MGFAVCLPRVVVATGVEALVEGAATSGFEGSAAVVLVLEGEQGRKNASPWGLLRDAAAVVVAAVVSVLAVFGLLPSPEPSSLPTRLFLITEKREIGLVEVLLLLLGLRPWRRLLFCGEEETPVCSLTSSDSAGEAFLAVLVSDGRPRGLFLPVFPPRRLLAFIEACSGCKDDERGVSSSSSSASLFGPLLLLFAVPLSATPPCAACVGEEDGRPLLLCLRNTKFIVPPVVTLVCFSLQSSL